MRFMLFSWLDDVPGRGADDLSGTYGSLGEAVARSDADYEITPYKHDYASHVYDTEEKRIVATFLYGEWRT